MSVRRRFLPALVLGMLAAMVAMLAPAAAAVPARAPHAALDGTVAVQVVSVSPSTPALSMTKQPLTFVLQLTNTTATDLGTVTVHATRATPIENQRGLDSAIAAPKPPDNGLASPVPPDGSKPVTAKLGPNAGATLTYRTSSDIPQDAGLCLCHKAAIYPIYFSVTTDSGELGHAQTYLPVFDVAPKPERVSWIWPLVDRPHRLSSDTTFIDDDLAASVQGGRLDRMLQVVENVEASGGAIPMTLLIDPAMIDELAVMSGSYRVGIGATSIPGTAQTAAQEWLARLRAVLNYPGMELAFTAPGDPDVQALEQSELDWQPQLDAAAQQRVQSVLGAHTGTYDLAWPYQGVLRSQTLDALASQGVRTVVVSDTSLPGRGRDGSVPDALAPLTSSSGGLYAVVTSHTVQQYVEPVLSIDGEGASALPQLVSQVAINAVEHPTRSGYLAIAAPRDLDPDPAVAARAIRETASTSWSTPLPVAAAVASVHPVQRGSLSSKKASVAGPAPEVLSAAHQIADALPMLNSLLGKDTAVLAQLATLPGAIRRLESIGWIADPDGASALASGLLSTITGMSGKVHLVRPSGGSYTLASSNAPLPITVANDLPYTVEVRVSVSPVNGLPGLTATPQSQQITPRTRVTVKVPVKVQRTGRFQVVATVTTLGNSQLGDPIYLSVHSTVLGTVGIVITIVAGCVLALALVVRFTRVLLRRRRRAEASVAA